MNRAAIFTLVFATLTALAAFVACDSQWSGCKPGSYPENGVCVEGCPPGTTEQSDGICIPSDRDTADGDYPFVDGDEPDGDTPDGDTPDGDSDGDSDGEQPDGDTPDGDVADPALWPMWGYDRQRTGVAPFTGPRSVDKLEKLYEFEVTDGLPSPTPVVDSIGRIYIPLHERVLIYGKDGRPINDNIQLPDCPVPTSMAQRKAGAWAFVCRNGNIMSMAPGNSAPRVIGTIEETTFGNIESDPLIGSDGTMYFVDVKDNLYAVDPEGTLLWSYYLEGLDGRRPVMGHDETIYLQSSLALQALGSDPDDEDRLQWSVDMTNPTSRNVIVDADGNLYFISDQKVRKANANGEELWASDYLGPGSLALSPNGGVYYAGPDLYKFSDSGTVEWVQEFEEGNIFINMIVDEDGYVYYVTGDNHIGCTSPMGLEVFNERNSEDGAFITTANLSFGDDGLLWITIANQVASYSTARLYRLEGPTE